jgi:hypothetical protein
VLGVRHLATAEDAHDLHLVTLLEELPTRIETVLEVVLVDRGTDAQFLQLRSGAVRALLLLLLRVLELPEVEDPTNGRSRGRGHFDEVEAGVLGASHRIARGHDAHLLSVLVDQPDLGDADLSVDAVVDCCH